jgi:ATP-binding cassette subfamily F protein uup
MLAAYPGTLLLVSHDRDFLDRTVTATFASAGAGNWTVYAGGYSDMLAQRGADLTREPAAKPKAARDPAEPKAAAPTELRPARRRLSFHEKHALESLPKTMAELQAKVRTLHDRLDDPGLYARDRKAFDATSAALAAAQTELTAAEERWLELEVLREEIEGN